MTPKFLFLDCDSTLSAIEGIDELARLKGAATFSQVQNLTNQAMNGEIPLASIFARRLELIRPTRDECLSIGEQYINTIDPAAARVIKEFLAEQWKVVIISGGLTPCIRPLADYLGIADLEAVNISFDANGRYQDFDRDAPSSRNGGKPILIKQYLAKFRNAFSLIVGDGISDLECAPVVNQFIACLTFVSRPPLIDSQHPRIHSMRELSRWVTPPNQP